MCSCRHCCLEFESKVSDVLGGILGHLSTPRRAAHDTQSRTTVRYTYGVRIGRDIEGEHTTLEHSAARFERQYVVCAVWGASGGASLTKREKTHLETAHVSLCVLSVLGGGAVHSTVAHISKGMHGALALSA